MENEHRDLADEVLRKIGTNILLFQQIEQSLKLLLPFIYVPSSAEQDIDVFRKNTEKVKLQTLGSLVGDFIKSADYNVDYFSEHLKKIVDDRNNLVHHFGDLYGLNILNTEEGCRACIVHLETQRQEAFDFYRQIQLFLYGLLMCFREHYGEFTPEIDLLYNSIRSTFLAEVEYVNLSNPSETVWENTKIVKLLRLAEFNTIKVGAMTSLAKAGEFIKKQDPECTPKNYGIKTLKGILKASALFKVIESQDIERHSTQILYRSKAPQ